MDRVPNLKKLLTYGISLALFTWLGIYIYNNPQEFEKIQHVSALAFAMLLGAALIDILTQGLLLRIIVKPFNIHLSFTEWFGIKTVQLMGNYLVPFGGLGLRVSYLKKRHGLGYLDNFSTISVVVIIEFIVFAFFGLLSLGELYFSQGKFDYILTVGLAGAFIGLFTIILLPSFHLPNTNAIFVKINDVISCWHKMKNHTSLIRSVMFMTTMEFLSLALMFYLAFWALGVNLSFINIALVACLTNFSLYFRITPAAVGSYEASIIYPSRMFGVTIPDALLAAGLVRIATMVWYLSLGPIYSHILVNKLNEEPSGVENKSDALPTT